MKSQIPNSKSQINPKSQIPILQVKNLEVSFSTSRGIFKAVDGISFAIERGSVFGLVGESGSGKTVTALSILNLIRPPGRIAAGNIAYNGSDILKMERESLRQLRGSKISMVFQEPASALNPVFTAGDQIVETIITHHGFGRHAAIDKALEYLKKVHISEPVKIFHSYPHQLSGGTRQRVMIAMALVNSPSLVILDEPTTALDVTVQAQILELLDGIIRKENLSILFISHDLGVISRMCDSIAVMRSGRIVEYGNKNEMLNNPKDPYTVSLLESVRVLA